MDSAENAGRNWSNWIEIPVEEFERAQSFYETIFDIEIQVMDLGALKMGIFPGRTVGCAICKGVHYAPGASGPVVYLDANPDLEVVQQRILSAGGKVLMAKKQISPEHGFMALFQDTEGNRLALHSNH
ncbi:MAG: VOC family protein [Saprospiraceae bacterium]|nr:VOC family protein [Saprospiraceae bacterium]